MAFPLTINPNTPADGDSAGEGNDQIKALKLAITDVLGLQTDPTQITAAMFSTTAAGVITVIGTPLTVKQVVSALGTITADTPNISSTVTWNEGSTVFTAIKLNVTDTASAATARLLGLQVGGADKFVVIKTGAITTGIWQGTAVGTQYGGTGTDFSAQAKGSVTYFSDTGVMSALAPGAAGQMLQTNGAGAAPSWASGVFGLAHARTWLTTGDVSVASATFANVTGLSASLSLVGAHAVSLSVVCNVRNASGAGRQYFADIIVDGTTLLGGTSGLYMTTAITNGAEAPISFSTETAALTQAVHTFQVQIKSSSAAGTQTALASAEAPAVLIARELWY